MSGKTITEYIRGTQVWKSIFRHGPPDNARNRAAIVAGNVFLHLHPIKLKKSEFSWVTHGMGGLSFFVFLALTVTGVLLMFYHSQLLNMHTTISLHLRNMFPRYYAGNSSMGCSLDGHYCLVAHVQSFHDRFIQTTERV